MPKSALKARESIRRCNYAHADLNALPESVALTECTLEFAQVRVQWERVVHIVTHTPTSKIGVSMCLSKYGILSYYSHDVQHYFLILKCQQVIAIPI